MQKNVRTFRALLYSGVIVDFGYLQRIGLTTNFRRAAKGGPLYPLCYLCTLCFWIAQNILFQNLDIT